MFVLRENGCNRWFDINNLNPRSIIGKEVNPAFPHLPRDPFLPGDGPDMVLAFDVQARGHVRSHLAERLLRRANVDRLPVAVQHQHNRLVQDVSHKMFRHCSDTASAFREVRCLLFVERRRLAASPGFAPGPPVSETGALLITPRGI